MNGGFFHRYRFGDFHGGGFGRSVWMHDPGHRLGVPYPNRALAQQFRGNANGFRGNANGFRGNANSFRGNTGAVNQSFGSQAQRSFGYTAVQGTERLGNRQIPQANFGSHSAFGPIDNGSRVRTQSDHGYSSMHSGGSAPRSSGGGGGGGGHAGGGGGGGHASGGGGRR